MPLRIENEYCWFSDDLEGRFPGQLNSILFKGISLVISMFLMFPFSWWINEPTAEV